MKTSCQAISSLENSTLPPICYGRHICSCRALPTTTYSPDSQSGVTLECRCPAGPLIRRCRAGYSPDSQSGGTLERRCPADPLIRRREPGDEHGGGSGGAALSEAAQGGLSHLGGKYSA
eukprot:596219-Pyramimonas_sp.AAC.1